MSGKKNKDDFQPTVVKQKIIKIPPMALVSLFMEGNKIGVNKGIQPGTRYVGGGYDAATNCFFLHVENDRYEETEVGERLPSVEINLKDLKGEK